MELTQFAIVSHRLADTDELAPLLQVVPSKTNQERLLLVTPELASVLAAIISRIRNSDGTVPLGRPLRPVRARDRAGAAAPVPTP